MNADVKDLANRIGNDVVAATRAMSAAIALTCRSLQQLTEGSDAVGMPELGSGDEAMAMVTSLHSMVAARHSQVSSRVSLLRKSQKIGVLAFGENCPCGGAIENGDQVSGSSTLALS